MTHPHGAQSMRLADGRAFRGPGFRLVEHRDRANMAANLMPDILRAEP